MSKLIALGFAFFLFFPVFETGLSKELFLSSAIADDDDGDDDGDDDDDSDTNSGQGTGAGSGSGAQQRTLPRSDRSASGVSGAGSIFAPLRRLLGAGDRPASQPRRTTAPPVLFVAGEIIVLNINTEDLQSLLDEGYRVLEQRSVVRGQDYYRLAVPDGLPLQDARDAVRSLPSVGDTDYNHFYRPESEGTTCVGKTCAAFQLVNWPDPVRRDEASCTRSGAIGMIDTGINEKHPVFAGADLTVQRQTRDQRPASKASHGTAVAALLVGQPGTRVPGLLPNVRLVAVDAFHRAGRDERADAFTLVAALYSLAAQNVSVINLSLAGPQNTVVGAALRDLARQQNVAIVAAAGNNGPNGEPVYPAAYEEVLAVTAVDRNKRVYRRANRGAYIDLAAPGVNVWTAASVKGAKWKTGTSFAVPFASAAVALLRARHTEKTPEEIYELLRASAHDLGESGHDPVYGAGLLQAEGLC
ncbi:S8 family serine peptidase [Roseibium album]|uniref:S8 family serine peptidase n=1 Tax=Roseibium album TaxID=311410 RepID=UPI0032970AC9